VYVPGTKDFTKKRPSAPDRRESWLSTITTSALATGSPRGLVTTPVRVAVESWARAVPVQARQRASSALKKDSFHNLRAPPSFKRVLGRSNKDLTSTMIGHTHNEQAAEDT